MNGFDVIKNLCDHKENLIAIIKSEKNDFYFLSEYYEGLEIEYPSLSEYSSKEKLTSFNTLVLPKCFSMFFTSKIAIIASPYYLK